MKALLCSFICLFVLSFTASAQTVPKGADSIELTTMLSDSALFESVQDHLENEGFDLDVVDEGQGAITSEYKLVKGGLRIRILATIENSVVTFKGESSGNSDENESLINEDTGAEGFLALNEIITHYAKTLDQAIVEYHVP